MGTAWLMVLCAEIAINETLALGFLPKTWHFFYPHVHSLSLEKLAEQIL